MKGPHRLQVGQKSRPDARFRSPKEKAAPGALGLTPVTPGSWVLKTQWKGVCDCIIRDLKVETSNLETADSVYLGGHTVFCTHSHSPRVQEKGFGDPLLPHLRSEWLEETALRHQLRMGQGTQVCTNQSVLLLSSPVIG